MPLVSELELPEFDYTDPNLGGPRFHERMRDLRARGWLASSPLGFFVLEREAASFFLRTRSATFPGLQIAEMFDIRDGPLFEEIRRNILHINGDDHRRLRNLVNPAFTTRAADRWRPDMRRFAGGLCESVSTGGSCEFVADFAKPYPSQVIAAVMGAPLADAPRLHAWSNMIQRQFDPASIIADRVSIDRAVEEFYEYAGALLEARRATPGEDLISTLIAAEQDGDRLSDVECVNLVLNVLVGGVDTTQSQLAHAIRLLATHPVQWARLRDEPALAGRAVEEALRFEPITPFTARVALEDIEYEGVTFPEGTIILVSAFHANREPDAYSEPERFDITADRGGSRPLTFGAGIHFCLGANLAKAEMEEALVLLSGAWSRLELDGEPEWDTVPGIYGMRRLPIRFEPA